jgi:hypothetical protein
VTGNSTILLQATNTTAQVNGMWQGAGVTLNAGSLQVDAGSSINADGQGYISDAGPGATSGEGGSYGGAGGDGYATSLYGAAAMPVDLGSGGSRAQYVGSNGGGAIRLIVSGTLTNNGTISANGEQVEPSRGAGGSGGSVYVTTGTLSGSGTFTANGGANTTRGGRRSRRHLLCKRQRFHRLCQYNGQRRGIHRVVRGLRRSRRNSRLLRHIRR